MNFIQRFWGSGENITTIFKSKSIQHIWTKLLLLLLLKQVFQLFSKEISSFPCTAKAEYLGHLE